MRIIELKQKEVAIISAGCQCSIDCGICVCTKPVANLLGSIGLVVGGIIGYRNAIPAPQGTILNTIVTVIGYGNILSLICGKIGRSIDEAISNSVRSGRYG